MNSNKKYLYVLNLLLVIIFMFITLREYRKYDYSLDGSFSKDILINDVMNKLPNDDLDNNFLSWIYDNYHDNSLLKLKKILDNNAYSSDVWHDITGKSYIVLRDLYENKYLDNNRVKIINDNAHTMSFVGDVSLADNWYIMPKYDERGRGILGIIDNELLDIMKSSSWMVVNNEFTVSNRGERMPGKYYTFRASPQRLSIYEELGVDLVTLANNHVYDFGKDAFYDMLDSFNEYNIPYIGAGRNIKEAMEPYYLIINGYKIAFINATRAEKIILTPEAGENDGGVFRCYDPSSLIKLISDVKKDSDFVITLIHWGREDSHYLEDVQTETAKLYIDAGADVIIGSHAHVLQGIEFYKDKPIIYNLGDFIFNNETKDTGIFQIKLNDDGNMTYYFIPAIQKEEYTSILKGNEKQRVINDLNTWSINAVIDDGGQILKKQHN